MRNSNGCPELIEGGGVPSDLLFPNQVGIADVYILTGYALSPVLEELYLVGICNTP